MHDDAPPSEFVEVSLESLRLALDCTDLGHRLAAVGNRNDFTLTNLADDLGEPRLGFVGRIDEAHSTDYNQSDWCGQPMV